MLPALHSPATIVTAPLPLTACPDCDLLQRLPVIRGSEQALCPRCGAVLLNQPTRPQAHTLALVLSGAILFLIANGFPIVTLDSQGMQVAGTLLGAVALLWQTGMHFIALMVLTTAFFVPGAELALLLIALNQRPPAVGALRWLERLRPWAMIDVFVLGALVSIKKLADIATIIPGPALWAFCALMFLITAIRSGGGLSALWARASYPGQAHVG